MCTCTLTSSYSLTPMYSYPLWYSFTHSVTYSLSYSLTPSVTHSHYLYRFREEKSFCKPFVSSAVTLSTSFSFTSLMISLCTISLEQLHFEFDGLCILPWHIPPAFSQYISHASLFHLIWPKSYPIFKKMLRLSKTSLCLACSQKKHICYELGLMTILIH